MKPFIFILFTLLFIAQVVLMLGRPYDVHVTIHVIISAMMYVLVIQSIKPKS